MNRRVWLVSLFASPALIAAACSTSPPAPSGSGGSMASASTGGTISSTGGGGGTGAGDSGGHGGSGGSACFVDGAPCAQDEACCSGRCEQEHCLPCAPAGSACPGGTGCCKALACAAELCCAPEGLPCAAGSECCASLVCSAGKCAKPCMAEPIACTSDTDCCGVPCVGGICAPLCAIPGGACSQDADCCDGKPCAQGTCDGMPPVCTPNGGSCGENAKCCSTSCNFGTCGPCPNAYSCADLIHGDADQSMLCGDALGFYLTLLGCLCDGACQPQCSQNLCNTQNPSQACVDCAASPSGCGGAYETCLMH